MYTAKHWRFCYSAGEEETRYWGTHSRICQIFQFCILSFKRSFSKIYDYIHEFKSNGPFSVFLPLFLSATVSRVYFFLEKISQLDFCDTVVSLISLISVICILTFFLFRKCWGPLWVILQCFSLYSILCRQRSCTDICPLSAPLIYATNQGNFSNTPHPS